MSDILEQAEAWLQRECARLDAILGVCITGGTVRVAPVPYTGGEYAVISGVDFEAERDGRKFIFKTEGNFTTPLKVVGFEGYDDGP
jgi:hypothetical protein